VRRPARPGRLQPELTSSVQTTVRRRSREC
jgi:hypothetical protein